MKLSLKAEKDVTILCVAGPVSPESFKVIKAGITKLLKEGKNKLVIELNQWSDVTNEVIQEISQLNSIAQELAGKIIISQADDGTKAKIKSFSTPHPLVTFDKTTDALQSFVQPTAIPSVPATPSAPKPATPTTPATAAPAKPGAAPAKPVVAPAKPGTAPAKPGVGTKPSVPGKPGTVPDKVVSEPPPEPPKSEFDKLRDAMKKLESSGLAELRRDNEKLKIENLKLRNDFQKLFMERKIPANEKAFQERIASLELQLKEILDSIAEKKK